MELKIRLLSGIYIQEEPRTTEIVGCLGKNIENPIIEDVHLFAEDPKEKYDQALASEAYPGLSKLKELHGSAKVIPVPFYRRPTYRDFFDYANRTFPPGAIVMITNSDIEYDGTLFALENVDLTDRFLCLSREGGKGSFRAEVSQDTWIWKSPIRDFKCDWTLGIAGGDNKVAYEAAQVGYEVLNPCLSVYTYHRHTSKVRHWTIANRLRGGYLSVHPSRIEMKEGRATFTVIPQPPNQKQAPPRTPVGFTRPSGPRRLPD